MREIAGEEENGEKERRRERESEREIERDRGEREASLLSFFI